MIGTQLDLPESARDGEQDLLERYRDAQYAFAAAARAGRQAEERYFNYIKACLPQLAGWHFSINHVTGKITILRAEVIEPE